MTIDNKIAILKNSLEDKNFNWSNKKKELKKIFMMEILRVKEDIYLILLKKNMDQKNVKILDFGCGSGTYVIILLLMGYKNTKGVDIVKKFNNQVIKNLKFSEQTFELIDGKLPLS